MPSQIPSQPDYSKLAVLTRDECNMLGDDKNFVASSLYALKNYFILSVYTRALLIKSGQYALVVLRELLLLNDAGLLTKENLDVITKPQHVSSITYVLKELNKNKMLNNMSRSILKHVIKTTPDTKANDTKKFRNTLINEVSNATALQAIHETGKQGALPEFILQNILAPFFKQNNPHKNQKQGNSNQNQTSFKL